MTGPGHEMAAAAVGDDRLRASHADRDQVIEILKVAFVQGRLTKDELDARVGHAFTAQTYGELATLTADIPAGLAAVQMTRRGARARAGPGVDTEIRTGLQVIFAAIMLMALLWVVAIVTYAGVAFVAAFGATATVIAASALTGTRMLGLRLDMRARRSPPPGPTPGVGGHTAGPRVSADPAEQLPQAGHGQHYTAESASAHPARPQPSSSQPPRQRRPYELCYVRFVRLL